MKIDDSSFVMARRMRIAAAQPMSRLWCGMPVWNLLTGNRDTAASRLSSQRAKNTLDCIQRLFIGS